ncbi:hypothetical protein EBU99_07975 [bacterium]|nr:hypothetical protein [bacterium]
MVNLDLLSKNAAALLPVSGVVDTVIVRLGRLLANKLLDGGYSAAAHLLALESSETPSHEEADHYLTQLDCPLMSNLRSLAALASLQSRYESLEDKLLGLLAVRARRELNTITEDPPLATRLAQEIEALLAVSPARGTCAAQLSILQKTRLENLTVRCQELMARPSLSWSELVRAENPDPTLDTLWWASRLAQAVSLTGSVIHRLESQFGQDPIESKDHKHSNSYRQMLKHKHRHVQQLRSGHTSLSSRTQTRRWEDESAQLMTERNFHAFAICVDQVIGQLMQKLEIWSKHELTRVSKQKARLVEVENFHYVDGIRRGLHQIGESMEDALGCADKLLNYCHESQVAAVELMDDEIWSLYPRINRENLRQVRMKVRHSDEHFPLSVAHREWITRVTEQALLQNS